MNAGAARSLHPGTAAGAKLHVVRRKHDRFARTECCSAAGWDAANIPKLARHFSSADGAVTRVSRAGAAPLTRFDAPGHCPACGGDGSVGVGAMQPPTPNALCVKDASKMCGLARYNGLKCGNEPPD